jgi:hypothetical protein
VWSEYQRVIRSHAVGRTSRLHSPSQLALWTAETVERLPWNDSEVPVAHEEEEQKPDTAEDEQMAGTCAV